MRGHVWHRVNWINLSKADDSNMREITVLAPAASVHHSKFSKSQFTSHHWSRQTVKHFPNVIHLLPHTSTQLYVALHILQSNSRVRKEKKHSPRLMSFFVLWHNKTYFTRELNNKTHGNWKFFCHLLPNYPPVRCWRHLWTALGWFGTLRRTGPHTFATFFFCAAMLAKAVISKMSGCKKWKK